MMNTGTKSAKLQDDQNLKKNTNNMFAQIGATMHATNGASTGTS